MWEVPADFLAYYSEQNGAWVLEAEGADDLRRSHSVLMAERESLNSRLSAGNGKP